MSPIDQKEPPVAADALRLPNELKMLVQACIAELMLVNEQLRREIDVRRHAENEHIKLINGLRKALKNMKTGGGRFPLCTCRSGRENRAEPFISAQTMVNSLRPVCPACAIKNDRNGFLQLMSEN